MSDEIQESVTAEEALALTIHYYRELKSRHEKLQKENAKLKSEYDDKIKAMQAEIDKRKILLNYYGAQDCIVEDLETENTELRKILNDFLTTKVCSQTWVDEMRATIDDVLNGDKE